MHSQVQVLSFATNVICVFVDTNWMKSTNKHAKQCEEAQQKKKQLIEIWESHGKNSKLASVQKDQACTHPSFQIDAEESLERFEQWVQWDLYPFIKESITLYFRC